MTIAPEKKAYATIVLHAIGRLTRLPDISNNVGSVKLFLSTLPLVTEKSFSLSFFSVFFLLCIDGQGSLVILRSASVRPKHLFDPYFDHDYFFKLPLQGASCPACEPNSTDCEYSQPLRHIQYNRTATLRAIATLAMRRSRRIARCRYRRRQSGS